MGQLVVRFSIEGEEYPEDEEEALRKAFHLWVALVFAESQMRCPVRSGRLLASSVVVGEEDWREIVYDTEYAEEVEDGRGQPGEKFYFEGRHYVSGAVDEMLDRFEDLYRMTLSQDFNITEGI